MNRSRGRWVTVAMVGFLFAGCATSAQRQKAEIAKARALEAEKRADDAEAAAENAQKQADLATAAAAKAEASVRDATAEINRVSAHLEQMQREREARESSRPKKHRKTGSATSGNPAAAPTPSPPSVAAP